MQKGARAYPRKVAAAHKGKDGAALTTYMTQMRSYYAEVRQCQFRNNPSSGWILHSVLLLSPGVYGSAIWMQLWLHKGWRMHKQSRHTLHVWRCTLLDSTEQTTQFFTAVSQEWTFFDQLILFQHPGKA